MGANEPNNVSTPDDSPKCPECGGETRRRVSNRSGVPFWGCVRYPECKGLVDAGKASADDGEYRGHVENAFRRELSRDVLLKLMEQPGYFGSMWEGATTPTIGQVAVAISDELIQALTWTDRLGDD